MRDVLPGLTSVWRVGGIAGVATATVVRTLGSSPPRPAGAAMMVAPDGTVAGSVSGGCLEAAVYELADEPFAVGLTCGGEIDIFAEPMSQRTVPQLQMDRIATHRRGGGRPLTEVDGRIHHDVAP